MIRPQNPRADILPDAGKSMGSRAGETPFTPDEPDVLDGGDGLQGFGAGGLATGSSSASGCLVIFSGEVGGSRPRLCQSLWLVLPNWFGVS
jgi:hypothetical protein